MPRHVVINLHTSNAKSCGGLLVLLLRIVHTVIERVRLLLSGDGAVVIAIAVDCAFVFSWSSLEGSQLNRCSQRLQHKRLMLCRTSSVFGCRMYSTCYWRTGMFC